MFKYICVSLVILSVSSPCNAELIDPISIEQSVVQKYLSNCTALFHLFGLDSITVDNSSFVSELSKLQLYVYRGVNKTPYSLKDVSGILKDPGFDKTRPTVIVLHGFNSVLGVDGVTVTTLTAAMLARGSMNVLALDTANLLNYFYLSAVVYLRSIGSELAKALIEMKNITRVGREVLVHKIIARFNRSTPRGDGLLIFSAAAPGAQAIISSSVTPVMTSTTSDCVTDGVDEIHLVGYSLGAHLAGIAGKAYLAKVGTKISRITGLSIAGPCFYAMSKDLKLQSSDADFVDAIYTDPGVLGTSEFLGHVNFFPNNPALAQPGCLYPALCSHRRSVELFAESLIKPANFPAVPCADWSTFSSGACTGRLPAYMGYYVSEEARGVHFCRTNMALPYGLGAYGVAGRSPTGFQLMNIWLSQI